MNAADHRLPTVAIDLAADPEPPGPAASRSTRHA